VDLDWHLLIHDVRFGYLHRDVHLFEDLMYYGHIRNLFLELDHLYEQGSLMVLHHFNGNLFDLDYYLNFRDLDDLCFHLGDHYLLSNFDQLGRKFDNFFHRYQLLKDLRHSHNSFSVSNKLNNLLMSFLDNLIFGHNNRIVFLDDLINCLLDHFLLNNWDRNSLLPLDKPFHNFLDDHFHWLYPLFDCFNVSHFIFYNLLDQ